MSDFYFRFKSLTRENIVYTFTSDSMEHWKQAYHMTGVVSRHFAEYNTYGDGDVQHTPQTVCHKNNIEDLFASLAAHLSVNAEDMAKFFNSLAWPTDRHSERDIRFALSIKYNEKKRQYFSTQENKVSSADSKRHDRRWNEVPSYADGSVESAYRLLYQDHFELLDCIILYTRIQRVRPANPR